MDHDAAVRTADDADRVRAFLEERVIEHNVAATGFDDGRDVALVVRDGDSAMVAGLSGWTWGGCLFVEFLWVRADLRGHGYGTSLMDAAETEARARGCTQALLATHSFQAPVFYERRGYEVRGVFAGYPAGHCQYFLRKILT